jgi:hypothetical protein
MLLQDANALHAQHIAVTETALHCCCCQIPAWLLRPCTFKRPLKFMHTSDTSVFDGSELTGVQRSKSKVHMLAPLSHLQPLTQPAATTAQQKQLLLKPSLIAEFVEPVLTLALGAKHRRVASPFTATRCAFH